MTGVGSAAVAWDAQGRRCNYCSVELSTGSGKDNYISDTVYRDVTLTTTLGGAHTREFLQAVELG